MLSTDRLLRPCDSRCSSIESQTALPVHHDCVHERHHGPSDPDHASPDCDYVQIDLQSIPLLSDVIPLLCQTSHLLWQTSRLLCQTSALSSDTSSLLCQSSSLVCQSSSLLWHVIQLLWQSEILLSHVIQLLSFGAPSSVCTIGGVGGSFQNGLQDYVGLDPLPQAVSAGDWDLHVQSDAANDGQSTAGHGMCLNIDNRPLNPTASIRMATGGTVDLGSTNNGQTICAISQVGGGMQGSGDYVHITIQNNGQGEHCFLEGAGSALAAARCWNP